MGKKSVSRIEPEVELDDVERCRQVRQELIAEFGSVSEMMDALRALGTRGRKMSRRKRTAG